MGKRMEQNALGIAMSYYRQKEDIKLEKVCEGLCSPATLNRVEQGQRSVDSLLGTLLLERIGKEAEQLELLQNEDDYVLWKKRRYIKDLMQQKLYSQVRQELGVYRAMKQSTPRLHEQFCLYQEVIMGLVEIQDIEQERTAEVYENVLCIALEALRLTKPEFGKKGNVSKQLYTQTEIELILILMHYSNEDFYARQNIQMNLGFAEEIRTELLRLLEYVEFYYTERRKEEMGITIIMELVELENRFGNDAKAVEYIEKGIRFMSQGRGIKSLERLHFLKAQVLERVYVNSGNEKKCPPEQRQVIQRECLMAYCICEVCGLTEMMKEIEVFCEERLEWQITGLVM